VLFVVDAATGTFTLAERGRKASSPSFQIFVMNKKFDFPRVEPLNKHAADIFVCIKCISLCLALDESAIKCSFKNRGAKACDLFVYNKVLLVLAFTNDKGYQLFRVPEKY
jgi:hypothetical protein